MRCSAAGVFGIGLNGPFLTHYYRFLDKTFGSSTKNVKQIGKKLVAEQLVSAPICNFFFFGFTSFYNGGATFGDRLNRFKHTLSTKFISTWLVDCAVWPAANVVNFKYVPVHLRPSYVSFVQLFWNTYICSVGFHTSDEEDMPTIDALTAATTKTEGGVEGEMSKNTAHNNVHTNNLILCCEESSDDEDYFSWTESNLAGGQYMYVVNADEY